jgi:hypothetical protein
MCELSKGVSRSLKPIQCIPKKTFDQSQRYLRWMVLSSLPRSYATGIDVEENGQFLPGQTEACSVDS